MEGGFFEGPNGRDPISEMLKKKSEQSQPWVASGSPAAASDHTGRVSRPRLASHVPWHVPPRTSTSVFYFPAHSLNEAAQNKWVRVAGDPEVKRCSAPDMTSAAYY